MERSLLEALNVRVVGSGERVIVLGHGMGSDQSVWNRILPYLIQDHRVVLYDLACAGSVNPDHFDFGRYTTLDAFVDDLLCILDALQIERCTYVGHSISGTIGILASIRRPELFSKLVLIGFSPRFLNDTNYHGGFEQDDIDKAFSAMEDNYDSWVSGYAQMAVGPNMPEAVQEFRRMFFKTKHDITLFVLRIVLKSDLRGVLGSVKVPCSIIQTERDPSVPTSVATYLKNQLGGRSTVHMLNVDGHLPQLSAPTLLVEELRRALP